MKSISIAVGVLVVLACSLDLGLCSPVLLSSLSQFDTFGERLLQALTQGETIHDNVVVSPLSISMALTATMAGARGETNSQIRRVLFGDENDQLITDNQVLEALKQTTEVLLSKDAAAVELDIANAMVLSQGFPVLDSYASSLREYLSSEVFELDFGSSQPEDRVNQWAAEKTRGAIPELLSKGTLSSNTRLLLLNAVYFNATWLHQFDIDATYSQSFHASDGEQASVEMMHRRFGGELRLAESPELGQVLELPYNGGSFAMYIHLPPPVDSSTNNKAVGGEHSMFPDVDSLPFRADECVEVSLPKFKLEPTTALSLNGALNQLGMVDAFDVARADLSGVTASSGGLFVSDVLHKTMVQVGEKGTEAAAVTVVEFVDESDVEVEPQPPCANQFRVDRPFAFVIRHTGDDDAAHQLNLFSGRVNRL